MAEAVSDNPLEAGGRLGVTPDPVTICIFGITGDLAYRKLVPSLFSLAQENYLPTSFNIVGFARRDWDNDYLRNLMREAVEKHSRHKIPSDSVWESFANNLYYVKGNFGEEETFVTLDKELAAFASKKNMPDNRLYYLSAPPSFYDTIIDNLGYAEMAKSVNGGWRRIIIEKPFGVSLATAEALNDTVHRVWNESQVYRIDHYLGKETVQNILVLRFANAIFEPIWNRQYVDHIQISVAEAGGIEGRGEYYHESGIVRDIVQNHLLQLLTLVCMEPPVAYEAGPIRDEKVKVLRALRPLNGDSIRDHTVRAQYGTGTINGKAVPAYLDDEEVPNDSQTATYTAMKLFVDTWRWQDVPIYIRSGKRMTTRATEISIHFKQPPQLLFHQQPDEFGPNVLALRIQPNEGITLRFDAKLPGQGMVRRPVTMDFSYGASFGITAPPAAYERLLLDAVLGDSTLFARSDDIEFAWKFVDPILEAWEDAELAPPMETYEAGTWGPQGAVDLLGKDSRAWRRL